MSSEVITAKQLAAGSQVTYSKQQKDWLKAGEAVASGTRYADVPDGVLSEMVIDKMPLSSVSRLFDSVRSGAGDDDTAYNEIYISKTTPGTFVPGR